MPKKTKATPALKSKKKTVQKSNTIKKESFGEKFSRINNIFIRDQEKTKKHRKIFYSVFLLGVSYFFTIFYGQQIEHTLSFATGQEKTSLKQKTIEHEKTRNIYFFGEHYSQEKISFFSELGYNVHWYDVEFSSPVLLKEENEKNIVIGQGRGSIVAQRFATQNNIEKIIFLQPMIESHDVIQEKYFFPISKILFTPNQILTAKQKNILVVQPNRNPIFDFEKTKDFFRGLETEQKYFIELDNKEYGGEKIIKKYLKDFLETGVLEQRFTFVDAKKTEQLLREQDVFANDLYTDSSIARFTNPDVSFDNIYYVPEKLEKFSSEYIQDLRGSQYLRKEANEALQKLGADFYKKFGFRIPIVSAYRSYSYQKGIIDRGCSPEFCSKPGFSEHQGGLAIDILQASTKEVFLSNEKFKQYFMWLNDHAHEYGYHNTYQKGIAIDGYQPEPWHWRYLGVELATHLKEEDITFAEFYKQMTEK